MARMLLFGAASTVNKQVNESGIFIIHRIIHRSCEKLFPFFSWFSVEWVSSFDKTYVWVGKMA
jgi:hypothetical protein